MIPASRPERNAPKSHRAPRLRPSLESVEPRVLLAAYASIKSGLWSDETVWGRPAGSGEFPKAGDVATIATNQVVTVASNATVGAAASSGVDALKVFGRLDVNSGVSLTVRGDVLKSGTAGTNGQIWCSGNLTIDGAAVGAKYKLACGNENNTSAKLVFSGSPGAHASFVSTGDGSTNAYVATAPSSSGPDESKPTIATSPRSATRPTTSPPHG